MEWIKLLSKKFLGEENNVYPPQDGRSEFQRDFDRIVFCSAFRRLQDKTQVFPLPENDFVHTRLTHSLEVSCVGRSLGNLVGSEIVKRHPELNKEYTGFQFGEAVAAACLAHDIGNPPFGHSGEDAIAEYFRTGNGKKFQPLLSDECWNDFIKFEGNAQGFRIITRIQNPAINGGLRLTCATLGAFTKYPKESFSVNAKNKTAKEKFLKKFGFFQSEKEIFKIVAEQTGLERKNDTLYWWARHPLAFLVEASDDICYRLMDLEDGFRLGLLNFTDTDNLFRALVTEKELKDYRKRDTNDKIGYLRAKSINNMVNQTANLFLDHEKEILDGNFNTDLLSQIPASRELDYIKKLSVEKIYSIRSVVEREAAGYEVLGGLLDAFITAVNEEFQGNISYKNKILLQLLPKQFLDTSGKPHEDLYNRLLNITDFVSGMTDTYAISLYRKIKGISLPGI